MKEYEQPETRIKRVKDVDGERFYAQYKQIIIPYIWWEWQNTRPCIESKEYTNSLEVAKERVDGFLFKSKKQWYEYQDYKERKKMKPEIEYIKYP